MPGGRNHATRAAIRIAEAAAREKMDRLDRKALAELTALYREAAKDIEALILARAGQDGSLQLSVLRELLAQVNARIETLAQARDALVAARLGDAATIGVSPLARVPAVAAEVALVSVANDAVQFVRSFVAADGLQLSDRLWRLDQGAREALTKAIESAIIQGHGASRAAAEFLARGEAVPADIAAQLGLDKAATVARKAGAALTTDEGAAYQNALRVMRTEINRAHGQAYQEAFFAHPDAIGTRFLLSPAHPAPDICDLHASANLYGLGPGVYPPGASPWPAHPNTLSYEEGVYRDEVSAADKAGRTTRLEWLKAQSAEIQAAALRGEGKAAALRDGLLADGDIELPWGRIKSKLESRGFDVSEYP